MEDEKDLERFSEKEIQSFKKLRVLALFIFALSIVSLLVYFYVRYSADKKLSFCQSTGLYRTINNNKMVIYTSDDTEVIDKELKNEGIAIQLSGDILIPIMGGDFNTDIDCSDNVKTYIADFCNDLNSDSKICLTDLFPEAYLSEFGDGEHIYYPYDIDSTTLYSREWVDKLSMKTLGYSMDELTKPESIPDEIMEIFGNDVLGYIPCENPISEFMDESVKYEDGKFYVDINDLRVDSQFGYIDFFGERGIDLIQLTPSKELRQINPENRFTWIMEDSETKGEWCTIMFSNEYYKEVSTMSIKVSGDKVTDIKILGFDS